MNLFTKEVILLLTLLLIYLTGEVIAQSPAQKAWEKVAHDDIIEATKRTSINKKAKNVILFLGDGMSITTITASRILKGQQKGNTGEEGYLSFERLPNVALLKTYNVDKQVPDSAGTSTAYMSGVKANFGTVGVDENVKLDQCGTYEKQYDTTSVLEQALAAGKQVGFVTTTRITHASPGSTYAHTPNRDWENDSWQKDVNKTRCPDIAKQFLDNAIDFRVVFGGGRREFMMNNQSDPEYVNQMGSRTDGRDLLAEWKQRQTSKSRKYKYVTNQAEFDAISTTTDEYILGMFEPSHMKYDAERSNEPSISEMVKKAIAILGKSDKGYALFVEGGRIDHAHHDNYARLALLDTLAFDKAIEETLASTKVEETLLIVTSDHSHVFTMGGWTQRGNPILGLVDFDWEKGFGKGNGNDGKPLTTLLYTDGPSAPVNKSRPIVTANEILSNKHPYQALVPLNYESHGGDDVALYARGPMSHLFHRVHEQVYVAQVMRYATCIGTYLDGCPISSGVFSMFQSPLLCMLLLSFVLLLKREI